MDDIPLPDRKPAAVLTDVCESLGLDPGEITPGCMIVQHTGKALVTAMRMALAEGDSAAAELVACECVGGNQRPRGLGASGRVCASPAWPGRRGADRRRSIEARRGPQKAKKARRAQTGR